MRAVSFFGDAAFCVTGSGPGAGLRGTVGRVPRPGGFGGGLTLLNGLTDGGGIPGAEGGGFGAGGGGTKGLSPPSEGGGGGAPAPGEPVVGSLVVSFFGETPGGGTGFPGTLMRTVSRLTAGCSLFGGRVMRIVSLFVASSDGSDGVEGVSSAIRSGGGRCSISPRSEPCQLSTGGTFACRIFSYPDTVCRCTSL